jgi:hypothetical protein
MNEDEPCYGLPPFPFLSKVFPYGVSYTMEARAAAVWAVLDLRRDPEWIREQLRE